jgi:uncharacterized OsmC-like protein
VGEFRALIATVESEPKAGMTRWRVTNTWRGQAQSAARVDGFEIGDQYVRRPFAFNIDAPSELGGANRFANPQEHLLAALNACMSASFAALCALNGVEIESLEVVTEGQVDLRGFLGIDSSVSSGYDELTSVVTVRGSASAEVFQDIFEAMLAMSPNVHGLTHAVRLNSSLVLALSDWERVP